MLDISPVPPGSIAGVASFRDLARMHAVWEAEFGVQVPDKSSFIQCGAVTLACLAPARFLASGAAGANLPARLAQMLDGVAAVTDQSDMWAAWRVSGANARECLARVVPVDVAAEIFRVGDLALTRAGHLNVRLFRVDVDIYEIAVTRSVGADLLHALEHANKGLLS